METTTISAGGPPGTVLRHMGTLVHGYPLPQTGVRMTYNHHALTTASHGWPAFSTEAYNPEYYPFVARPDASISPVIVIRDKTTVKHRANMVVVTLISMGMIALMIVTAAGTIEVEIVAAAVFSQPTAFSCSARPSARLSDCAVRYTMAAHADI